MPGEAYERRESFDGVIYNSAGLPLFRREKQMPATHGREKKPTGNWREAELPAETVNHHLL